MATIEWDADTQRRLEQGVSKGVLYVAGATAGVAWSGLTGVTESPSGAEETDLYADNIKYGSLVSLEKFGATINAYTYPDEFAECDGSAELAPGVFIGQQKRKRFGLSYVSNVVDDAGNEYEKIHLLYGCIAKPSSKDRGTINESPEAMTLSWELTTSPVKVDDSHRPTSYAVIDTRLVSEEANLQAFRDILYGTVDTMPRMPTPSEIETLIYS